MEDRNHEKKQEQQQRQVRRRVRLRRHSTSLESKSSGRTATSFSVLLAAVLISLLIEGSTTTTTTIETMMMMMMKTTTATAKTTKNVGRVIQGVYGFAYQSAAPPSPNKGMSFSTTMTTTKSCNGNSSRMDNNNINRIKLQQLHDCHHRGYHGWGRTIVNTGTGSSSSLHASVYTPTSSTRSSNSSSCGSGRNQSMDFSSSSHSSVSDTNIDDGDAGSKHVNLEPLVVCGPSGVGKGTIIQGLLNSFLPSTPFGFCVSHTTRSPRPGEVHGVHYTFTSVDDIQSDIKEGKFIEYAEVHGNYYGTSKDAIRHVQSKNQIAILDIDVQGVMSVKESFKESNTPCKYIFMAPPSMEELEKRLRGRGTESEESIRRRLGNAAREIEYGNDVGNFDHILINNDVDGAVQELITTLKRWYPQLDDLDQW